MKKARLRVLTLTMVMALVMLLPMTMNAQNDNYFRASDYEYFGDRATMTIPGGPDGIWNNGIGQNESPLGSGLLIMVAAGAGYVALRRKRSSHKSYIPCVLLCAMLVTFTQCKKNVETITDVETDGVMITLRVDNDSKVIVNPHGHTNPNYATVTFEKNDKIYVGNHGKFIGSLTYSDGVFSGNITNPSSSDYLHFYFVGNKKPSGSMSSGSTTSIVIDIIDQRSEYPVISYAHTEAYYNSATTEYRIRLLNKCAIMKFTTNDIPASSPVAIYGMKNKVTVDFTANNASLVGEPFTFDYVTGSDGKIILHPESTTERWAILLPQDEVTATTAASFGYESANTFTVPAVVKNGYYSDGVNIELVANGTVNSSFTVNSSGKKVRFSIGNLQYFKPTEKWSFKGNQYDMDPTGEVGDDYSERDVVSHFGYGTSGWNSGNYFYQPYNTYGKQVSPYYSTNGYGYGPINNENKLQSLTGDFANADWGVYNSTNITNGGGLSSWRTPTTAEWNYIIKTRSATKINNTANARYTSATINIDDETSVRGTILFPDVYTGGNPEGVTWGTMNSSASYNTTCTLEGWDALEAAGCVFLPAAGVRNGIKVQSIGNYGNYWSSTLSSSTNGAAEILHWYTNGTYSTDHPYPYNGMSVRLIRDVE